MADNKCFCHLNGYEVKDATARKTLTDLVGEVKTNRSICDGYASDLVGQIARTDSSLNALIQRVTALENNAGGGSAKIYRHRVLINTDFGDDWADNIYASCELLIYRSTPDPINTLSKIHDHEFINFKPTTINIYDAPEAVRLAYAIYEYNGILNIECYEGMDDYQGFIYQQYQVPEANLSISDTVVEV